MERTNGNQASLIHRILFGSTRYMRHRCGAVEGAEVLFEKVHSARFHGRLDLLRHEVQTLEGTFAKQAEK